MERTLEAVTKQLQAMGSERYEVGLFKPDVGPHEPAMLPRTWDSDALMRSVLWLRHQNRAGRNVYVRPAGEHNLTLIDDLSARTVAELKVTGYRPALVVETSPGNYQAWLKHPEVLPKELSSVVARNLARQFGGDPGAADWRHFGRLGGFTNKKLRYMNVITGLYPFVKVVEASGQQYEQAGPFLDGARKQLAEEQRVRAERSASMRQISPTSAEVKTIEDFRTRSRYQGDATRVDLAYALYAFSRGIPEADVRTAISSRDLSHKGNERRQSEYVERTVRKALSLATSRGR